MNWNFPWCIQIQIVYVTDHYFQFIFKFGEHENANITNLLRNLLQKNSSVIRETAWTDWHPGLRLKTNRTILQKRDIVETTTVWLASVSGKTKRNCIFVKFYAARWN